MAMQQQPSSVPPGLGARIIAAHMEHKHKPVDTGNRRLPPGIRNAVGKLSSIYFKRQDEDGGTTPKGEWFFRASAICLGQMLNGQLSEAHNGEKIAGMVTQVFYPLCDMKPTDWAPEGTPLSAQWAKIQNVFMLLGVNPPNGQGGRPDYNAANDPDGAKVWGYYQAAITALTREGAKPVYISFSTEGFTPKQKPGQPPPEPRTIEKWHGLATAPPPPTAGAGMADQTPSGPPTAPPAPKDQPKVNPPPTMTREEEVNNWVALASNDPDGETPDGYKAQHALEKAARDNNWPEDQIASADWPGVGRMALYPPHPTNGSPTSAAPKVAVGSQWMYSRRNKDGIILKDKDGNNFAPVKVEVLTLDEAKQTCTVKDVADGKEVQDVRSKKPTVIRFDWLDSADIPY